MDKPSGLGKGLRALIPEGIPAESKGSPTVLTIPLDRVVPSRFQPRMAYDEHKLHELMNSISESGVLYPILVREKTSGGVDKPETMYELIAGERRFRAVKQLGLTEIPAIVKRVDDAEAAKISLIENLQRQELTAIEEALAYRRLQQEFEMTQEEVARAVGKERVTVTNTLRLLQLPKAAQEAVSRGEVGMAHARALLGLPNERLQGKLLALIQAQGLSVRRVEALVRIWTTPTPRGPRHRDPQLALIEEQLRQRFGTRVRIHHGRRRGHVVIEYYSLDDLNRLLGLWKVRG